MEVVVVVAADGDRIDDVEMGAVDDAVGHYCYHYYYEYYDPERSQGGDIDAAGRHGIAANRIAEG